MLIGAIDIGYTNLGIVIANVENYEIKYIYFCKRVNIGNYNCKNKECKIPHTREVCDIVAHFVQEYNSYLLKCDIILVERQPPGGLGNVESVICYIFRPKIQWVSPTSMHKHHMISHYDYEGRKVKTEEIASEWLKGIYGYDKEVRKHDMADAMCMILFWAQPKRREIERKKRQEELRQDLDLERFKCC